MFNRFLLACGLGLMATLPAQAQTPPAAAASASQPAKSESAAAMERAQRLAANPMRVIMMAGKIRRRAEPEALPDAADPASLRRIAARPASETTAASAAPVPAPARSAAPATPEPEAAVVTSLVLQSAPLAAPSGSEVAPLQAAPVQAVAAPTPKMVVPQALLSALVVQPKLVTMVEPDIPLRVQQAGPAVTEVAAELKLLTDGTVAEVNLLPPVPRAWQPYIVAALKQWRYEPLSETRHLRVQLVFSPP